MSKIVHTNIGGEFKDEDMHDVVVSEDGNILVSIPPSGKYKIVNTYWDEELQKVVTEKSTEPEP